MLTDGNGQITEGPGFNLFALRGGHLMTPARGVLLGITRQTVIDLAETLNVKVEAGPVSESDLRGADEIFLSSTAGGVMPVSQLDGKPVGDGGPGPLTWRIREMYWAAHDEPRYTTAIQYS